MTTTPIILVCFASAAFGAYNLRLWFRRARRPELIALHLFLGAAAMEMVLAFLRNIDLDANGRAYNFGFAAICFMALAMFSGFCAALLRNQPKAVTNALLAAHVGSGVAGFFIVLAFVSKL
jgi:uncharacterized BrkB/YihY/UPF0761 family membrane protein